MTDPRVSLTIIESISGDVQAKGRFTYLGKAMKVSDKELAEISKRYTNLYPESKDYFSAHGFSYYRIKFEKGRFIGGFGKIFWITPGELLFEKTFSLEEEQLAIDIMNKDHKDVIKRYVENLFAIKIGSNYNPSISRISPFGFDIRINKNLLFYPFPEIVCSLSNLAQTFEFLG